MTLNSESFNTGNVEGATALELDSSQQDHDADPTRNTPQEKSANVAHGIDFDLDSVKEPEQGKGFDATVLKNFVVIDNDQDDAPQNPTSKESVYDSEKPVAAKVERAKEDEMKPTSGQIEKEGRIEQRLMKLNEQLRQTNLELSIANRKKHRAETDISECEKALGAYNERYDALYSEVEDLKKEIKTTRRSANKLTERFRRNRSLALGKYEEARELLENAIKSVNDNERATNDYEMKNKELNRLDIEGEQLDDRYEDAISEKEKCRIKIIHLENQKAKIEQQIKMIEDERNEKKESEERKKARDEIIKEAGTTNMWVARRELGHLKKQLSEEYEKKLREIDEKYLSPSEMDVSIRGKERIERDQKAAEQQKEKIKDNYVNFMESINSKRDMIDKYFPTPIDEIVKNKAISRSLNFIKRKVLMKIYGIS